MKTMILFTTLFSFLISLPVSAELTDADLDKIRLLILESEKRMKEDIAELSTEIVESEKRMKAGLATLQIDVARLEGSVRSIEKMISWLMVLIVVVVAVPSGITAWRSRKDREQEKINQELREEIEMLKQRQPFSS